MNLDKRVAPLVEFFNSNGLKTIMSCQGHNKTNMSMFWIEFDKSIQEQDIINFMNNHKTKFQDGRTYFFSCGRFAQRIFMDMNGKFFKCWCYFAATPDAADEDLERWRY